MATPDTDDLLVERRPGIAVLTVNRPDEQNRLTPEALAKLERLVAGFATDTETNVIVITGQGDAFSAGILNPALRAELSKHAIIDLVRLAYRTYTAIENLPQIVIGALNGLTRAGGAELAFACDIRLASDTAVMSFPEAAWGGFPGAGAPARLAELVGKARALEMICTGRPIKADELERLGLVQAVHPRAQLHAAAMAMAETIAAAGPLATRGAKRIINARLEPGAAAARELSDALRYALEWSEDVDEAIAAQHEGRAPHFTGR
jgi:enoyl-CoA hydratase/carnithine racemase